MNTSKSLEAYMEKRVKDSLRRKLGDASFQVDLDDRAFEAIDRALDLGEGDVLLCETSCLRYAAHLLDAEDGVRELWLIPPINASSDDITSVDSWDCFEDALEEQQGELLKRINVYYPESQGLTGSVPDGPFKLLITAQYGGDPILPAATWPQDNSYWNDMLRTEGASGAVIYPPLAEQPEQLPSLREGSGLPETFVRSTELPGGHIMLSAGNPGKSLLMEDLSDADDPWAREVPPIELAANGYCLVPSTYRTGVEVLDVTTLGELASRISRGTSVSEKDLAILDRLDARVVGPKVSKTPDGWTITHLFGSSGGAFFRRDSWCYAAEGDFYYVDGSCFNNGEIWPILLECMPRGQERYIVDQHDGEVLLVSRNSKQVAVYRAHRPTLVANSVFVIRIGSDISRDYLACWMRGHFAKGWLHDGGKMLSKKTLSSLPVPILDEGAMEQAVSHERSIDERMLDLREEVAKLEMANRFNPLAAGGEAAGYARGLE